MYSFGEKLGIEIIRENEEISQRKFSGEVEKTISYEVVRERNEMFFYSFFPTSLITVSSIFLLMELIKIKEEKGLDRILLRDSMNGDFQLIKEEKTECRVVNVLNESQVRRVYDLIERLCCHPNTWVVRFGSRVTIKTKTSECILISESPEEEYGLYIKYNKKIDYIHFNSFSKVENAILNHLKSLEIKEVFERMDAMRAENCARIMLGFFVQNELINKIYQHKNIIEIEKKLMFETISDVFSFMRKEYNVRYGFVGNYLFGFIGKDLLKSEKIEVIIERFDVKNDKNKREKANELIDHRIKIMESKEKIR